MRQSDSDRAEARIKSNWAFISWLKERYKRLFPRSAERRPAFAVACYNALLVLASYPHKRRQNGWFPEVRERIVSTKKMMVFLVPEIDTVTGGVMSICHIADRSVGMRDVHGCEVILSTMPGGKTLSGYTGFACDWRIFRFQQIVSLLPQLEELYIQVPDAYVSPLLRYMRRHKDLFRGISDTRLNILDQNIELMPPPEEVRELAACFGRATQTCAHERYCTAEFRERYGIPTHLLPADIPARFYHIPYGEKENLIAYSNDENPHKERVLAELKERLPEYRFLMIENMAYDEYLKTISRAKWTLTFGEGWDCYYIQPYFSGSIGFTVFNEAFCPERMRASPTAFPDYETLSQRIEQFIRENDKEDLYCAKIQEVLAILYPPAPPDAVPYDALLEFYRGNYTFP